ncbi:MAG: Bax inhibitor-1/YccA family protein [Metamycoplasmataceae bacterium]
MNINSNKSFPKIFQKSAEKASTKNLLISYALMWMGVGVALIFLMTYLVMAVEPVRDFVSKIALSQMGWTILLIANMGLILTIAFLMNKLSTSVLVVLYLAFVFIQGLFISTSLYYSGFGTQAEGLKNVFLLFLVPSGIFVIMGLLGYFQIFDFSKLGPFLFFATIGLIFFSIFVYFFGGDTTQKWYSLAGIIIFSLWIGFDIWWIQRTSQQIEFNGGMEKAELIRIGLVFGIRLFIDFINILLFVARLVR